MPGPNERVIGGHDVLFIGYSIPRRVFYLKNSWDETWGMDGDAEIPFEYGTDQNLSRDFWTATSVGIAPPTPTPTPGPNPAGSITIGQSIRYSPDPSNVAIGGTGDLLGTYKVAAR
jgi:hypothetical protein